MLCFGGRGGGGGGSVHLACVTANRIIIIITLIYMPIVMAMILPVDSWLIVIMPDRGAHIYTNR